MKYETIRSHLEGIPFMDPDRAEVLFNFVLQKKPSECLELGFAHGASSCYIAAALEELGRGHLTTVDLTSLAETRKPSIEDLLSTADWRGGIESYQTRRNPGGSPGALWVQGSSTGMTSPDRTARSGTSTRVRRPSLTTV